MNVDVRVKLFNKLYLTRLTEDDFSELVIEEGGSDIRPLSLGVKCGITEAHAAKIIEVIQSEFPHLVKTQQ